MLFSFLSSSPSRFEVVLCSKVGCKPKRSFNLDGLASLDGQKLCIEVVQYGIIQTATRRCAMRHYGDGV